MKIVLKELVNRVGLPTGSLICTLTTYTDLVGLLWSGSAEGALTPATLAGCGRFSAGACYPSGYPRLREGSGHFCAPQLCVLGEHMVLIKYVHSITISLLLSLPFFCTLLICF